MGKKREMDDRFKKFGTVSFTATTKVNDFVTHLEEGKVMGTKCTECDAVYFPPRADCAQCLSSSMEWFEVNGKRETGDLQQTGIRPHRISAMTFPMPLPYWTMAITRSSAGLPDVPEDEIEVGMEMTTRANTLDQTAN
jgi:hypothetical protein